MQRICSFVKLTIFLLILFSCSGSLVYAQSIEELQLKITDKNSEIKNLENEINRLDKSVKETAATKKTLRTELRQVDAINKKLTSDVKITAKKIELANFNVSRLEKDIEDKNKKISDGVSTISGSLREANELGLSSLPEKVLSGMRLSELWKQISTINSFQSKVSARVKQLGTIKKSLEINKKELISEKSEAIKLKNQISDQQKIAAQNIVYKNKIIKETTNKEANFKKLLAETEARKRAVEDELVAYESELRVIIDPNSLPQSGKKILSWPLELVKVTQYFGNTAFAREHSIYNGKGHNGLDLRAAIGTSLKASLGGTVMGTGDTDPVCNKASYGKWIMIDHHNGLATIYGHLSLIKVAAGEIVNSADIIGYTGNSGYATGPHLHFTVAATQAVKIGDLKSKVKGCGTYTIPLGPFNGYLNPLLYL